MKHIYLRLIILRPLPLIIIASLISSTFPMKEDSDDVIDSALEIDDTYPYILRGRIKNFGPKDIENSLSLSQETCLFSCADTAHIFDIKTKETTVYKAPRRFATLATSCTLFNTQTPLLALPATASQGKGSTVFWRREKPTVPYLLPIASYYAVSTPRVIFTGTVDASITCWDAESQKSVRAFALPEEYGCVHSMDVREDENSLSISTDSAKQIVFDIRSHTFANRFYYNHQWLALNSLRYSTNGTYATMSARKKYNCQTSLIFFDVRKEGYLEKIITGMEKDSIDGWTNIHLLDDGTFFVCPRYPSYYALMSGSLTHLDKPLISLTSPRELHQRADAIDISADEKTVYIASSDMFDEHAISIYEKNKKSGDIT